MPPRISGLQRTLEELYNSNLISAIHLPQHAHLHDTGRAEYIPVTDEEAVQAFEYLSRTEGIIPAIESAHAVSYAMRLAKELSRDKIIIITISGRGDKDCASIARYRGEYINE